MTDHVSSAAYYQGTPAWHGKGIVKPGSPATFAEALRDAGADYEVVARPPLHPVTGADARAQRWAGNLLSLLD